MDQCPDIITSGTPPLAELEKLLPMVSGLDSRESNPSFIPVYFRILLSVASAEDGCATISRNPIVCFKRPLSSSSVIRLFRMSDRKSVV